MQVGQGLQDIFEPLEFRSIYVLGSFRASFVLISAHCDTWGWF